jgi:hypothetical protein
MVGAEAGSAVAVEILVEENEVPPVGIVLELRHSAVYGAFTGAIAKEQTGQASRELLGDSLEAEEVTRARGALHLEIISIIMMELLERLDEQIVNGKPDRPPPVRVSAEQSTSRLCGLVPDGEGLPVDGQTVWVGFMAFRE